jgi:hypothetical protein
MAPEWAFRNVAHEVRLLRSGAGSMPASARMRLIVLRPRSCPRLRRAPPILVYPQSRVGGRHPDHERGQSRLGWRTSRSTTAAPVVLPGDQTPVPAQQRIRRDDARHPHQRLASKNLRSNGQPAPLSIGRPEASVTELPVRMRFSSRRYSITCCWPRLIQPAMAKTQSRRTRLFMCGRVVRPGTQRTGGARPAGNPLD